MCQRGSTQREHADAGAAILTKFNDRAEGGQRLAEQLTAYAKGSDVLVVGLARGGVPVAYEVARKLRVPLDVFIVRKLGVPGEEELAMGAIASGGVRELNDEIVRSFHISSRVVERVTAKELQELARREQLYRGSRPLSDMRGRTVILVDDGIATGATMRAAIAAVRQHRPANVVVAVPVAAAVTCEELRATGVSVVCVLAPKFFLGVGVWYAAFPQTTDTEIRSLLERAWRDDAQAQTAMPEAEP